MLAPDLWKRAVRFISRFPSEKNPLYRVRKCSLRAGARLGWFIAFLERIFMSVWLLPENIADMLPREARAIEHLRSSFLKLVTSHGFEVVRPSFGGVR
mgnify:CR=1 FL=1